MIVFKLGDCRFSYRWSREHRGYLVHVVSEDAESVKEYLGYLTFSPEELPYFFECIEWVAKQGKRKLSDYILSLERIGGLYIG